ncbi:GNAT family N-acetyltransferase [Kutzneria buriramensis]|uniref:Acetyltransferase (GNAT) family protein n=1 Tax=Kutzneria buriramensis TaxID=1045776 RepID=A0A3E0H0W9_9PSEU|nr:GNAT family N-acetyltransferase [Kutzneria buriramensis]REH35699.1 Acetyltransferase (GNAT) family protein [Kutzneria buriramensis]
MSWRESVLTPGLTVRDSPLDGERFGVGVTRVTVSATSTAGLEEVLAVARDSTADVVVLRYPAGNVTWFAGLRAVPGRAAIFADTLTYWRLRVGGGRRPAPSEEIAVVAEPDPDMVADLMATGFAGYANHYAANPLFDPALSAVAYPDWACRSAKSGHAIAVHDGRGPLGAITWERDDDRVELLLAAVAPAARGRAVYPRLIAAVEDRASELGADFLVSPTQGHNIAGQRAWARYGFEPAHPLATVHLVRSELL